MNIRNRLQHLARKAEENRGFGKTELAAKMCRELDAILISQDTKSAHDIQRKFGVTSKSIEVNLDGFNGPFIFDNSAISHILIKAMRKIDELERRVLAEQQRNHNLQAFIDHALPTPRKANTEETEKLIGALVGGYDEQQEKK